MGTMQHVVILKGNKGEKIFHKIFNGPRVPYERLKKESDEIKKTWKTGRDS